ncbi:uncharacterized protein BDW70DRAFT_157634 [Aspergillus foveolatus]|uniref:uncharacterized protein n=1 Tax=Aspergillus foveolatus TaxID=210207 RepID=UPI003CCE374E
MSSVPSTPMLSQFSTPNQTSSFSSPSNSPEETHPRIIITGETDVFVQESIRLPGYGDDFAPTIPSLLEEYTGRIEQIWKQKLAEHREKLEAKITEGERLTEKVKNLEKQLSETEIESAKLEDQLAETAAQLSDAAKEYAAKEEIWNSVMGPLARLENENNEVREQLKEIKQQLERTNDSIAEERENRFRSKRHPSSA